MTDPTPLAALDALDPAARDLAPRPNAAALEFLLTRRSTPAKTLEAPGPDDATLARILRAAARSPDHKKLAPWRFIQIGPRTRDVAATAIVAHGRANRRDETTIEKAVRGFQDGPTVVAVILSPKSDAGVPEIEQAMSAGAVCAALVNAALASGIGANWLSGWPSHDAALMQEVLGLAPGEQVAGFIHLGTPRVAPSERPRPDVAALTTRLP